MKVGILQFFGWRDRSIPLPSVYEAALERFAIMDSAGYDAVWLAEHHFDGICAYVDPVTFAAALAAIYIVLGVLYESYIHPITILSTLPSAGIGALLALKLFDRP